MIEFVDLIWREQPVRIEHAWIGAARNDTSRPLIVFLHEGLGSVAMWKDFPARLCQAVGARGLVYSRPGYGRSSPRAANEPLRPDFMHRQAHEVLPALFDALGIDTRADKPWLVGHSDGASIALLHAARWPQQVAGEIVLAPHIMVEDISVQSIANARTAYLDTDLAQRLAKYHDDADAVFRGWNDVWLLPEFRTWSIEDEITSITCPLLAVQGVDDGYGTLEQIRGLARRVPHTQLIELRDCGHSPHRDQPDALLHAAKTFFRAHVPQLH